MAITDLVISEQRLCKLYRENNQMFSVKHCRYGWINIFISDKIFLNLPNLYLLFRSKNTFFGKLFGRLFDKRHVNSFEKLICLVISHEEMHLLILEEYDEYTTRQYDYIAVKLRRNGIIA